MKNYENLCTTDLQNEIWKDIKDFEGLYQASNKGRIKSLPKIRRKGRSNETIIMKQRKSPRGYLRVNLSSENVKTDFRVHNLVLAAFSPNPDNKPCCNHDNGVKTDNESSNLYWVTYSENTIHAIETGLMPIRFANGPNAKLDWVKVGILRSLKDKLSKKEIATIFDITLGQVYRILNNKRWVVENE
jgi:hypothetical protein